MHVIKLLDSAGTAVIDSVSSDYEDPLCLDPFEDLCQVFHQSNQKSFIIARVETRDHKQPDRSYYSYYNAFLLNKILFQTQVFHNKKLLHRLHVLNPLTNTDIIGDVQYFKVKLHSSSAADISPFATDSSSFKPTAPPISVSTNETSFDRLKLEEYSMNQSINLAKSPSVRQVEMMALTNQHADWTMTESRVNDFTETDPDVHSTSATNISENTSSAIPLENEHQESSDVVTPLNMSINRRQTMRRLSLRVKVEKQSSDKEHDTASQVFRVPMSPYTAVS